MFFKGGDFVAVAAADNEVEAVSNFNSLAGAGESFLQLLKSVAAIANGNRNLLKREFRVLVCVIGSS